MLFYHRIRLGALLTVLCLLVSNLLNAQNFINVTPADNLNTLLGNANAGDVFLVAPGDYGNVNVSNLQGTPTNPIVIQGTSTTQESRVNGQYSDGFNCRWGCPGDKKGFVIKSSQYVVVENIHVTGGIDGLFIRGSHHIIVRDFKVSDIGNTAIKVFEDANEVESHHIDFINGEVFDVGQNQNGAYAENFYLGQAQDAHDESHDIWIENVEIRNGLGGEGIDVKSEVYNITIRNCYIHDLEIYAFKNPNDNGDQRNQVNRGAIQLTAGDETTGKNPPNDQTLVPNNIWVEDNTIENITNDGMNNFDAADGIFLLNRPQAFLKNNTINNVDHNGIRAFGDDADYAFKLENDADNLITNAEDGKINIDPNQLEQYVANVGTNPLSPQTWYTPPGTETFPNIESVTGQQATNPAEDLLDGSLNADDRWSANGFPQTVIIDYGESKSFVEAKLWTFNNRAYRYTIAISNQPNGGWNTVVNRSNNTATNQPLSDGFTATSGRYVRLQVTALHNDPSTWVSIRELEMVEGAPPIGLAGVYFLKNKQSQRRMKASGTTSGADLVQGKKNNTGNAYRFELIPVAGQADHYTIRSLHNNFLVSPNGASTTAGEVVETSNNGGNRTIWKITPVPGDADFYYLESKLSSPGNLLKMRNRNCSTNNNVKIETVNGTGNCARWKLLPHNPNNAAFDGNLTTGAGAELSQDLRLYPQPAEGFVNVRADFKTPYRLISSLGQSVREGMLLPGRSRIELAGLLPGIYYLRYTHEKVPQVKKLIIK